MKKATAITVAFYRLVELRGDRTADLCMPCKRSPAGAITPSCVRIKVKTFTLNLVELRGIEPRTSLHAMQALSQLSYNPKFFTFRQSVLSGRLPF